MIVDHGVVASGRTGTDMMVEDEAGHVPVWKPGVAPSMPRGCSIELGRDDDCPARSGAERKCITSGEQ